MAKILVADDNSNVQKTVTLALANLGIEFLSVNNGDAAVRKLAEFAPDLVLADIFMPVRNGYEVCEYVKKDNRFSHVPVVLLVGAFDPLDEREAQRVGADGILKKPFVPPDPLITMVKMLLERTLGDRLVEVSASKPAVAARGRASVNSVADEYPSVAVAAEEHQPSDFPPPAGRVAFREGEHPVAFSQLLETPDQNAVAPASGLIEPVDDEQILTSSRDATLGDPIFWRNDEPESEPEPAAEEQLDDVSSPLGVRSWKQGDSLPRRDDALLIQPIEPLESLEQLEPSEPLELIREDQQETSQTIVDAGAILLDPAGQAPLTVESDTAEELAANPIEWMATAPSEHSLETSQEKSEEHSPELALEHSEEEVDETPGWDEPIPDATDTIDASEKKESSENRQLLPVGQNPESTSASAPIPHQASVPVVPYIPPVKTSGDIAAAMPVIAPVVTPALKVPVASAVTSAIVSSNLSSVSKPPETRLADTTPEPNKTQPSIPPIDQRAEDTARSVPKQDWADLSASIQSRASEVVSPKVNAGATSNMPIIPATTEKSQPAAGKLDTASSPDPALVDAVVQRVLDKMRPQVVDIITKEFLRPIVQALVTREIEKH